MEQTPNPEADLLLVLQAAGMNKEAAAWYCTNHAEDPAFLAIGAALSAYAMKLSRELAAAREDGGIAKDRVLAIEGFLLREGYVRCDIPACNCPYWHGGHASRRLEEIYDALGELTQGKTALTVVAELVAMQEHADGE